jgi:cytosine permease
VTGAQAPADVTTKLDALYEFERAPVSEDRLQPASYFAGLFAGEHVAATEFVIGALLVSFGASARDIVFGLLLGNLLAVLSWTLLCAPIAVDTRLTLYWYLRQVAGPGVTILYNLCNAVMYCILAGAMITVSASAVRLPFGIPAQTKWYPEDFRFVLVVLVVGTIVVTLAILGFRRLAQFAVVASPWMFLMFVAGAIVMLPRLAATLPNGRIGSAGDL